MCDVEIPQKYSNSTNNNHHRPTPPNNHWATLVANMLCIYFPFLSIQNCQCSADLRLQLIHFPADSLARPGQSGHSSTGWHPPKHLLLPSSFPSPYHSSPFPSPSPPSSPSRPPTHPSHPLLPGHSRNPSNQTKSQFLPQSVTHLKLVGVRKALMKKHG